MFIKTFASALVLAVFSSEVKAIQIEALLSTENNSKNLSIFKTLQFQLPQLQLKLKLVSADAQANTETLVRTRAFGTISLSVIRITSIVMSTGPVTNLKPATFAAKAVEMVMKQNPEQDSEIMQYHYLIVSSVLNLVRLKTLLQLCFHLSFLSALRFFWCCTFYSSCITQSVKS